MSGEVFDEFEVELARSGAVVKVGAGESILDALLFAGHDVTYSCMQGICGSCRTRVIAGTPDHQDAYLSQQERDAGDVMLICCSKSRSERLVLDL